MLIEITSLQGSRDVSYHESSSSPSVLSHGTASRTSYIGSYTEACCSYCLTSSHWCRISHYQELGRAKSRCLPRCSESQQRGTCHTDQDGHHVELPSLSHTRSVPVSTTMVTTRDPYDSSPNSATQPLP